MEKLKAINVSNKLTEENTHCGPDLERLRIIDIMSCCVYLLILMCRTLVKL